MKDEYLSREHSSLAQDKAIQICCLALRHYFINLQDAALDKKSNFDYIEKEIGLHKFLPAPVLSSTKRKALRKIIQSNFKKYVSLSDKECMIQFLEAVRLVLRYDQEKFRCALGVSNFVFAFALFIWSGRVNSILLYDFLEFMAIVRV